MAEGASNFQFLERKQPQLFRLGRLGEVYFQEDPNTCQIKLRQFAELLAQLSAARFGLEINDNDALADVLRRVKLECNIPREVSDLFHTLRIQGNHAVHQVKGDHASALTGLKIARQLSIWFVRTFDDPAGQFGAFIPPRPPVDDNQAVIDEVERLRRELIASRAEAQRLRLDTENAERAHPSAAEAAEEAMRERTAWEELAAQADETRAQLQKQIDAALKSAKSDDAPDPGILAENARDAAERIDLDEADTRALIDQQLRDVGWEADTQALRYSRGIRPVKGSNRAIAEWPTASGPADYALFCGLTLVGTIEAKRSF